jgi:hypothetical protein
MSEKKSNVKHTKIKTHFQNKRSKHIASQIMFFSNAYQQQQTNTKQHSFKQEKQVLNNKNNAV